MSSFTSQGITALSIRMITRVRMLEAAGIGDLQSEGQERASGPTFGAVKVGFATAALESVTVGVPPVWVQP